MEKVFDPKTGVIDITLNSEEREQLSSDIDAFVRRVSNQDTMKVTIDGEVVWEASEDEMELIRLRQAYARRRARYFKEMTSRSPE